MKKEEERALVLVVLLSSTRPDFFDQASFIFCTFLAAPSEKEQKRDAYLPLREKLRGEGTSSLAVAGRVDSIWAPCSA